MVLRPDLRPWYSTKVDDSLYVIFITRSAEELVCFVDVEHVNTKQKYREIKVSIVD